jgi:hypothetical protein
MLGGTFPTRFKLDKALRSTYKKKKKKKRTLTKAGNSIH